MWPVSQKELPTSGLVHHWLKSFSSLRHAKNEKEFILKINEHRIVFQFPSNSSSQRKNCIKCIFSTTVVSPGVDFINVFTCSFYEGRSKKCKKLLNLTVFLALLGSARVKANCKMLVKLSLVAHLPKFLPLLYNFSIFCTLQHFLLWCPIGHNTHELPYILAYKSINFGQNLEHFLDLYAGQHLLQYITYRIS